MNPFNDEREKPGLKTTVGPMPAIQPVSSQPPAAKDQALWTEVAAGRAKHPGKCPTCGRDR